MAAYVASINAIVLIGSSINQITLQAELRGIERCMRYCRILRQRQAAAQASLLQAMGIKAEDIYLQVQMAAAVPSALIMYHTASAVHCLSLPVWLVSQHAIMTHRQHTAPSRCRCRWLVC